MPELQHKWGYCPCCLKNNPHFCVSDSKLSRVFDAVTFSHAQQLRLGPWFCVHCETKSLYLKDERPDAPRFQSADNIANSHHSQSSPDPEDATPSVGNYLKADHSLVSRSNRLKRFSEKYRDSVVRRLLSGTTTISQIRAEKDIPESELLDWIADLVDRMQIKIDNMELNASSQFPNDQFNRRLEHALPASIDDDRPPQADFHSQTDITLEGQRKQD